MNKFEQKYKNKINKKSKIKIIPKKEGSRQYHEANSHRGDDKAYHTRLPP